MFCKFCGKEIADNAAFCPYCGGKLDGPVSGGNVSEKPAATGAPVKKVTLSKAAKKKLCIEVGIVLFAILAIVMIVNGVKKYHQSDAYHVKQCVKEAKALAKKEKYYDAAVKYKEAFAIDKTSEEAYIGSAEAFLSIKYYSEAHDVVKQGLSALPDSKNLKKEREQVFLQWIDTEEKSNSALILEYISVLQEAVREGCDSDNIKKPLATWYDIMLKQYEENGENRLAYIMSEDAYEILGDKKYKDKAEALHDVITSDNAWKTAYIEAMKEFMETTEAGNIQAWLVYMNNDDIPELLLNDINQSILYTYGEMGVVYYWFATPVYLNYFEKGRLAVAVEKTDRHHDVTTISFAVNDDGSILWHYDGDYPNTQGTLTIDAPYYTYDELCDYLSE